MAKNKPNRKKVGFWDKFDVIRKIKYISRPPTEKEIRNSIRRKKQEKPS